jgi:4-diphosphocytidyl-2-C-methyl-D-erythritol kinase
MVDSISITAPAKINIGLRVYPLKADGYHDIESIFQQVSLCDEITVIRAKDCSGCVVHTEGMVLPDRNTVTKVYDEFSRTAGITGGVNIHLQKNIPAGAGLGGGSSDASAVLFALDSLFGTDLSSDLLMQISNAVGSDVGFFTSCRMSRKSGGTGGSAVVTGRGTIVRQIEPRNDLYCVIVYPEVHSSTKEAYTLVDEWLMTGITDESPVLSGMEKMFYSSVDTWRFENMFSVPLMNKYPQIAWAYADIKQSGAAFVQMTGSGSAVYGVFTSYSDAEASCVRLSQNWRKCRVAAFL